MRSTTKRWNLTTAVLGALLLCVAQPALAQGRRAMSPAMMANMMTNRLDRAVTLTPEQKTKVHAIYEQSAQDMAAARSAGGSDVMGKMQQINARAETEVKELLTPEQIKKFPAGRGGFRGRRGQGPPPGGGNA